MRDGDQQLAGCAHGTAHGTAVQRAAGQTAPTQVPVGTRLAYASDFAGLVLTRLSILSSCAVGLAERSRPSRQPSWPSPGADVALQHYPRCYLHAIGLLRSHRVAASSVTLLRFGSPVLVILLPWHGFIEAPVSVLICGGNVDIRSVLTFRQLESAAACLVPDEIIITTIARPGPRPDV